MDVGATNIVAVELQGGRFRLIYQGKTSLNILSSLDKFISKLAGRCKCDAFGVALAGVRINADRVYMASLKATVRLPPAENVSYFKDSEAFAHASHQLEHPYTSSLAGVTIGTGIGLGLIINGRPYLGAGNAGELGHTYVGMDGHRCICGLPDHLEAYYSGWSFKGDKSAVNKPKRMLVLAKALASLVHILDPEVLVLGGGIGLALDIRMLRSLVYEHLLPGFKPRILKTRLKHAVAKGAALLAALPVTCEVM